MDRAIVMDELKKVLSPFMVNKEALNTITDETDLTKDLKINSANLVDIIIDAENRYDIEIDMDSAERIHNVGSCIDVIMEKMKQRN